MEETVRSARMVIVIVGVITAAVVVRRFGKRRPTETRSSMDLWPPVPVNTRREV
jgi:hypothetical protein